jgi:outer membrane receptor protein involved in Fe transport
MAVGLPFVSLVGYSTVGDPEVGPRDTHQNTLSFTDSVEWTRGRHDVQFGGEYRRDQINSVEGISPNGYFIFAPTPVNDSFASFLLGAPEVFVMGGGDLGRGLRGNAFSLYAQDGFRPTARLTLNFGLRYELPLPLTEIRNRQVVFEPGEQSKVMPSLSE